MSFWTWISGKPTGITSNDATDTAPNTVGPVPPVVPGNPDGFEVDFPELEGRALPGIQAAPWSGWPAAWATPAWLPGIQALSDTAWNCIDVNSRILSTMPVYKTRNGVVVEPETWMTNPDPTVYNSWQEFAKTLFRDYQCTGEAFVLATAYFSTGWPMFMRCIPPPYVTIEGLGASRRYLLGTVDITPDVLHIRYSSSLDRAHGIGPLDLAGARLTASNVLARYISTITTAPPPFATLQTDQELDGTSAQDLLTQWQVARAANAGLPAVLDNGITYETHQATSTEMQLLELAQYTDSRIAIALGVPPFLVGLPSGGDNMTYSNVSSLFDYHDRSALRPFATAVMSALSGWALPRGQTVELDRDEYTRPALPERATAYATLAGFGAITSDEVRVIEPQLYATSTPVSGMTPAEAPNG